MIRAGMAVVLAAALALSGCETLVRVEAKLGHQPEAAKGAAPVKASKQSEVAQAHEIVAEGVTALVVGPIATVYAVLGGPPTMIESRYKQVCEKVLLGTWVSSDADKCSDGKWANALRFVPDRKK